MGSNNSGGSGIFNANLNYVDPNVCIEDFSTSYEWTGSH